MQSIPLVRAIGCLQYLGQRGNRASRIVVFLLLLSQVWFISCSGNNGGRTAGQSQDRGKSNLISIECQREIEAIKKLQNKAFVPRDSAGLRRLKEEFKLDDYFNILTHLSVEKGWKIDYRYIWNPMGGYPVIYSYRQGERIDPETGYTKNRQDFDAEDYLDHIKVDRTEEGFFQYIVLSLIGSQFALGWHAGYNDQEIVCTKAAIGEILKRGGDFYRFDETVLTRAKTIDPAPTITLNAGQAVVTIVTFTKWGGFIEKKYYIRKQFPHTIIKVDQKTLVEYECGIRF